MEQSPFTAALGKEGATRMLYFSRKMIQKEKVKSHLNLSFSCSSRVKRYKTDCGHKFTMMMRKETDEVKHLFLINLTKEKIYPSCFAYFLEQVFNKSDVLITSNLCLFSSVTKRFSCHDLHYLCKFEHYQNTYFYFPFFSQILVLTGREWMVGPELHYSWGKTSFYFYDITALLNLAHVNTSKRIQSTKDAFWRFIIFPLFPLLVSFSSVMEVHPYTYTVDKFIFSPREKM